jgi:hypothetical protein
MKLQEIFVQVADALMPMFEVLTEIAITILPLIMEGWGQIKDFVMPVATTIIGLVAAYRTMVALGQIFTAIKKTQLILSKQAVATEMAATGKSKIGAIASIIKGAWSSLGVIPFVGAGLAVAAIAGAIATLMASTKGNDIMSPGQGSSGYGKRTLLGPEGAIQLNNKDTVIAGTNLFGNDVKSEAGKPTQMGGEGSIKIENSGGKTDMTSVINAINALGAKIEQLGNVKINIDGKTIAESAVNSSEFDRSIKNKSRNIQ